MSVRASHPLRLTLLLAGLAALSRRSSARCRVLRLSLVTILTPREVAEESTAGGEGWAVRLSPSKGQPTRLVGCRATGGRDWALLSSATLYIIPAWFTDEHAIKFELVGERGQRIAEREYEYSETIVMQLPLMFAAPFADSRDAEAEAWWEILKSAASWVEGELSAGSRWRP